MLAQVARERGGAIGLACSLPWSDNRSPRQEQGPTLDDRMDTLVEAIRYLEEGDWKAAHLIVQNDSSRLASWAHAIVHLMEGDVGNARYWYARAEREAADTSRLADEIAELKRHVGSG